MLNIARAMNIWGGRSERVIERLDAGHDVEGLGGPGRETGLVEQQLRRCASDEGVARREAVEVRAKAVEAGIIRAPP